MAVTESSQTIYPKFSADEYRRRHALLRGLLAAKRLDGAIVYGGYKELYQANARWLTGMRESMQFYAFFPLNGPPAAWNSLYPHLHAARRMSAIPDTEWGGGSIGHTVARHIQSLGLQRARLGLVGVHSRRGITLPMDHYLIWRDELPQAELVNITGDVEELQQVKSAEELAFYRRGAEYTDYAMAELIKAVRPGAAEVGLYGRIISAAYECGGDALDVLLLGSTSMQDPDMPYPRHVPSQRVIRSGDVVLNEISVGYGGCSGQLIIPISVGAPPPVYRDLYRVARETFERVRAVLRPGATQDDVLDAARVLTDAGLVAEAPIIHGWPNPPMFPILPLGKPAETYSPQPFVLREHQLIMIEPNPTTPDLRAGVFLGALCVVTPAGGQCLQRHPLDFAAV
ncbi:MAG TPA: M24 family metallopeptidase [bacterium]|nr:M24 family metallopeptidase [bacterium]